MPHWEYHHSALNLPAQALPPGSSSPTTTVADDNDDNDNNDRCVEIDANELGRWTRFAAKGGIGKCVAVQDCIAEEDEDLMFLKVRVLYFLQTNF